MQAEGFNRWTVVPVERLEADDTKLRKRKESHWIKMLKPTMNSRRFGKFSKRTNKRSKRDNTKMRWQRKRCACGNCESGSVQTWRCARISSLGEKLHYLQPQAEYSVETKSTTKKTSALDVCFEKIKTGTSVELVISKTGTDLTNFAELSGKFGRSQTISSGNVLTRTLGDLIPRIKRNELPVLTKIQIKIDNRR